MAKKLKLSINSYGKETNKWCVVGFGFGLTAVFLPFIGVIPLSGFVFSIVGLFTFNKEREKGIRRGVIGFILNLLYLFVNVYMNWGVG